MDTAWIQVFVLTMSECVAPSGKTVCQQQEYQLEFATQEACETARQELITLKSQNRNIIVDQGRTRCASATIEGTVFASLDEAKAAIDSGPALSDSPDAAAKVADFTEKAHKERLASLPTCEESRGRAPCKIGEIIVEGETQQRAEVWHREP